MGKLCSGSLLLDSDVRRKCLRVVTPCCPVGFTSSCLDVHLHTFRIPLQACVSLTTAWQEKLWKLTSLPGFLFQGPVKEAWTPSKECFYGVELEGFVATDPKLQKVARFPNCNGLLWPVGRGGEGRSLWRVSPANGVSCDM